MCKKRRSDCTHLVGFLLIDAMFHTWRLGGHEICCVCNVDLCRSQLLFSVNPALAVQTTDLL